MNFYKTYKNIRRGGKKLIAIDSAQQHEAEVNKSNVSIGSLSGRGTHYPNRREVLELSIK